MKSSTEAETSWIITDAPPLVKGGLEIKTLYGFIIRVVNKQGSGESAEIIFAKTDETGTIRYLY